MDPDQIKAYLDSASAEQRLAMAKAGIIMAILQEKIRMGYTNDEVATVLAMDKNNQLDEGVKHDWAQRLALFESLLEDEIQTGG